jgi:phosphoribosylcarboxyaminoimidazole (NCAIR) mutase
MSARLSWTKAHRSSSASPAWPRRLPLDEHGIDSCLYMPPGVPVFTMGVGSAGLKNAAIGACQVLAVSDVQLSNRLSYYLTDTAKPAKLNVLTHNPFEVA